MKEEKRLAAGKIKGSFTVEAAILVPILLFCIVWLMGRGITLYQETERFVNNREMWREFEPAEKFRNLELLQEFFSEAERQEKVCIRFVAAGGGKYERIFSKKFK